MPSRHFYVPVPGRERDACAVRHPIDGEMRPYGAFWTDDAFTAALTCTKSRPNNVLIMTDEQDPNPPKNPGFDAIMQQRRVDVRRPKMRIMQAPIIK